MTDIIRTAANVLKSSANKDDFTTIGVIATKEADADYDFFINSLSRYMSMLGNIREQLKKEKQEKEGLVVNCITYRCDFCKMPCKDRRQEGKLCGCFKYPDGSKKLYIVE